MFSQIAFSFGGIMNFLEERILRDGVVKEGNVLKVDSFLNHQMDVMLLDQMGREFYERFCGLNITKILTIEASGIAIACFAAKYFSKENYIQHLSIWDFNAEFSGLSWRKWWKPCQTVFSFLT